MGRCEFVVAVPSSAMPLIHETNELANNAWSIKTFALLSEKATIPAWVMSKVTSFASQFLWFEMRGKFRRILTIASKIELISLFFERIEKNRLLGLELLLFLMLLIVGVVVVVATGNVLDAIASKGIRSFPVIDFGWPDFLRNVDLITSWQRGHICNVAQHCQRTPNHFV